MVAEVFESDMMACSLPSTLPEFDFGGILSADNPIPCNTSRFRTLLPVLGFRLLYFYGGVVVCFFLKYQTLLGSDKV